MENKKTIEYLNSKAWYRALKVVFIVLFIFTFVVGNLAFINESLVYNEKQGLGLNGPQTVKEWKDSRGLYDKYLIETGQKEVETNLNFGVFIKLFFIGNLIILLIFEAIRRSFYYIVLGSLKPQK